MLQCFKFIWQICNKLNINVSQLLAVNGTNVYTIHKQYILYMHLLIRAINWAGACYRTKNGPALMAIGTVKIVLDYIGMAVHFLPSLADLFIPKQAVTWFLREAF